MTSLSTRRALAGLAVLASLALALVGPTAAGAENIAPQITLGPTTVLNGVGVISGTVSERSAEAELSINGQPVEVASDGTFAGVVNLSGQSTLSLALRNPGSSESSTVRIPLNSNLVGPGGLLPSETLDALQDAAVTLLKPADGFVSVGGEPIEVSGGVGNGGNLGSLSVNGVDALSTLSPDGGFRVPLPGTTREISVLMTDRQGVSLENRYATRFVSAGEADGVRVAKIRYFAKGVKKTKRIRVVVTVRDRRNLLVRGAVVVLRSNRAGRILGRSFAKSTNANGKATFFVRLRRAAFGKRNTFVVTAQTPSAKASKRSAVRLPRMKSAKRR